MEPGTTPEAKPVDCKTRPPATVKCPDSTPRVAQPGAGTSLSRVISEGAPKRFGGPQYPVPRLV